jgi:colanic acid biosynthesis glycosyl transferase WcaI
MKGLSFTEALGQRGFDVTVITGTPNYPSGKIYPGYKNRWHTKQQQRATMVHQVALYPSHDANVLKRILNYVSFFATASVRMLLLARRADVLYAYHPPLTVPFAAVLVGKIMRKPVVVEIQDLWPESLAATGMSKNRAVERFVGGMARFVYRRSDAVIAQSNGFRTEIIKRGAAQHRVHVVYNWADESAPGPQSSSNVTLRTGTTAEFQLLYAGNLGPAQDLGKVLDAATVLLHNRVPVRINLMGAGQSASMLQDRARAEGLTNVTFHPMQTAESVGAVLAQADALLVILKNDPLFEITVPSKTQASLAAGRPILLAVAGEAAEIVRSARAGVVVSPGSPEALVAGILQLLEMSVTERENLAQAGARYYEENLSFDTGVDSTARIINQAFAAHRLRLQ